MTTPPRILVVDDDPEIRKLLARYVESQGFRVLLAESCRELHEQLATHHVDLVVLDVMLPDGSGLDACRDLPGHPDDSVQTFFEDMVKDPVTLAAAKKRRIPMNTRTAAQVEAALAKGFSASPAAVNGLAKMLGFDKARKKKKKKKS